VVHRDGWLGDGHWTVKLIVDLWGMDSEDRKSECECERVHQRSWVDRHVGWNVFEWR